MGDYEQTLMAAQECVEQNLPHATTIALARKIREVSIADEVRSIRLAILATSNLDFLAHSLEVAAFADHINLKTQTAGFNQIDQEVFDPSSQLHKFAPDFAVISARAEDIIPDLARDLESVDIDIIGNWIDEIRAKLMGWCESLVKTNTQIILFSFSRPAHSPLGIRDFAHPKGQLRIWNRINEILYDIQNQFTGITVIDFDGLVRRVGLQQWEDPKLWALAKIAGGSKFPNCTCK